MDDRTEMYGRFFKALDALENCKEFSRLIPEVRTNMVYAKNGAKSPADVLAIDGRITTVRGMPRAAGKPEWGASSHMARLIIELQKYQPSICAGINFMNDPSFAKWLEEYCKRKGWLLGHADRSEEPEELKDVEGASMPWKVGAAVKAAGGIVPKMFYETGAVGKEPVSAIVGTDITEVVKDVCELAREYNRSTQANPKVGKIDFDTFESIISGKFGARDRSVIVPPLTGVDSGVVDIGHGKVLIVAEDPIFTLPKLSLDFFGWATVHIGASDVAVMGVTPRYMTYTLLLPPGTCDADLKTIVDSIDKAASELGITIVGGHTGYYPGFTAPTIGGITVMAVAGKDEYVTPARAKVGDDIILTKGPAIETAGILSRVRERELLESNPKDLVEKAKALCTQMTVVKDALTAMKSGGVTAMHDATEGGVIGGLFEIANASGVGMEVDEKRFVYPEEVEMVCKAFSIDPVEAIAEGSLLLTCGPYASQQIIKDLAKEGITASVIGKVTKDRESRIMKRRDGGIVSIRIPEQDPFWPAFFEALERQ